MVQVAVYGGTAYTGPGIVKPAPVIPAIFGVPETLPAFFHDPFLSGSTNDHSYLGAATHARIVVSSSPSTTPDYSVYVLEDLLTTPSGFVHDFIFYKGLNLIPASEIRATYVDGLFNTGTPASYPAPPTPTTFTLLGIKDKFITAFSNPYDNQDLTNGYNQYHCLYQPLFQNNTTSEFKQPLVILRGFDNGFANAGTTDTRLILNQAGGVLDDPTSYCGAVNQMGIHIHWRTSANDHFYVRDTRAFDEPIEEHTLLTNDCIVADGTAHGGTAGTQILDEGVGRVTLWTDPNYAANVSGGGLYFQYPGGFATTGFFDKKNIGTLTFNSSGLALTAGTTDGSSIASLYTMPLCSIAQTGSAGAITINPYSNWEYYGTNIPGSKDWGLASLTVNLNGPNTGSVIPNLNIHGGAIFWECAALNVSHGMINILFGSNINPINTTENTTDKVSGLLRVSSITDMHDSKINSYIPIVSWNDDELHLSSDKFKNVVMMITAVNGLERPSIYSLHSVNNIYTNFETLSSTNRTGAGAIILYDGNPNCSEGVSSPDKVVFNGDIFNRIRFHGMAPGKAGLELQSLIINDWDLNPIFIERSCSLDYKDILVYNVTFNNILDDMAPFDVAQGILIRDFNKGDRFGDLNVNNNQFIYYDTHSLPTTGFVVLIEAAIELDNSTGNVENNTIKSDIFAVGIWVHNDVNNNIIKPYLCNNFIKGLRGRLIGTFFSAVPGIKSDHYQGYVNLCTIDGCEYGYESDQLDNPFLIHSTIVNSRSSGLFIPGSLTTTNLAKVHLTGLHSDLPCTTCLDFAGNNNISNNGIHSSDAQILIEEPDQLCDLGKMVGSSWGSWGHNKIAQGTATTAWLIKTQYFDNSNPATFANIGSIDQNYWGGINPFSLLPIPNASASFAAIYTATNGSEDPLWVDSSSFFGCSDYSPSEKINQKNNPALLFQTPGWADTCAHLKLWSAGMPQDQEHYQLQYDTLRLFIEKCAVSDRYSYQVFTTIDGANQFRSDDTNRYTQYRSWLISVLYLNTIQPAYFCACMGSIGNTYQKANEFLSVWNYLRHNHPECWSTALDKQYSQDSASSAHRGENPTHLIPLDSLGLGFLLKGAVSPSDGSTLPSQYLASFTSSPNPFNKETTLQFTLNRMTYTTVAVYDELGRLVWGDGRGSSLEAGTHTIHLDASNFPSGTLYARISTGFGEVKTVKLIHE